MRRSAVLGVVVCAVSAAAFVSSAAAGPTGKLSLVGDSFGPGGRTAENFRDIPDETPLALAANALGDVFVQRGSVVRRFDRDGDPVLSWDTAALGTDLQGIAADGAGNVFLADAAEGRVLKYSRAGVLLDQWTAQGQGQGGLPGERNCPSGIAVGPGGNVYVTCPRGGTFDQLAPTGARVARRTGCSFGPIAVGSDDAAYFPSCDPIRNVIRLGPDGRSATRVGRLRPVGGPPGALAAPGEFGPWRPEGVYAGGGAKGVAADAAGRLWVADPENQRVQAFAPDGSVVAVCRPLPASAIEVVAAGTDGVVYVSDHVRVQPVAFASNPARGCETRIRGFGVADHRLRLSRRSKVGLTVVCRSAGDPCRGRLRLARLGGQRLGSVAFELAAETRKRLRLALPRQVARTIRRKGAIRTLVIVRVTSTIGPAIQKRKRLRLAP